MGPAALPIMAIATVASTGLSIYSSMKQGAIQQGAFDAEARAHELESKQYDLRAKQISASRLAELNANLGAIAAARAGKNLLGDSPTSAAIVKSFTRESLGAKSNEVLEARLGRLSALNAMYAARSSGKAAKTMGTLGAIGAGVSGLNELFSMIPRRKPSSSGGD